MQAWQGHWYGRPVGGRFSAWRTGEPNNNEGIEQCGELMWSMGGGGGWICRR